MGLLNSKKWRVGGPTTYARKASRYGLFTGVGTGPVPLHTRIEAFSAVRACLSAADIRMEYLPQSTLRHRVGALVHSVVKKYNYV